MVNNIIDTAATSNFVPGFLKITGKTDNQDIVLLQANPWIGAIQV
jgi:hypothetical protein